MNFSARHRRSLALLILGLVLGLAYVVLVSPVAGLHAKGVDEIAELELQLERLTALSGDDHALHAEIERLGGLRTRGDYSLAEHTASLAAATLQARLKSVIETSGGRMESMRVLTLPDLEPGLARIGVSTNAELSIEALQQAVHRLEIESPYVVIDELRVAARQIHWAGSTRGERNADFEHARRVLDVRISISGVWIAP
ncbi:MAG: hypothetical protein CMO26_18895 [Thiotrichales bacterium]|nr:hypothetical protein [Thiotrichales bacterium]